MENSLEREVESSECVAVSSLGTIVHWHGGGGVALDDSCGQQQQETQKDENIKMK